MRIKKWGGTRSLAMAGRQVLGVAQDLETKDEPAAKSPTKWSLGYPTADWSGCSMGVSCWTCSARRPVPECALEHCT